MSGTADTVDARKRGASDPDPDPDPDRTAADAQPRAITVNAIGRFVVQRTLGSGGMGVVIEAFDPTLDRKVAVKLLHPDLWSSDELRGRLQREGQAMARLSHPNVVTVHEVGELDAQPYLVMELVDGQTLRDWQRAARPWREVVARYLEAGRGLVAAHDAGLVHRDFKPDNVLIGRDGRARVGDFGLAWSGASDGAAAGTPSYMAPEQWRGDEVDAGTDQFAFSVALWEALFGERPFAGRGPALRDAVLAGERRPAPTSVKVPRWLAPALARGFERDPAHRWPTLAALLDELARRATPRQVPVLALGAATAAVVGALVFAIAPAPQTDRCPSPRGRLAGTWDDAARTQLGERLATIDPAQHQERFARAARIFDGQAGAWQAMHVEACRKTRIEGRQSDSMLDQRMSCLDDRLDELTGTIALLAEAPDVATLDRSLMALGELTPVDGCADPSVLTAYRPTDRLEDRPIAAQIMADARAVEVDRRAGRLDGLSERADAVLQRARDLGHPPLLGQVLWGTSLVSSDRTDSARAAELLRELIEVAARAGDDLTAAYAWCNLLRLLSFDLGKPAEAAAIIPAARAAVIRSGERLEERVLLLEMEAEVLSQTDRIPESVARLDEAVQLLRAAGADQPDSPLRWRLADTYGRQVTTWLVAVEYDKALAAGEAALVAIDDAWGPDHPDTAYVLINMSEAHRRKGEQEQALGLLRRALDVRERRLGDSPALAWVLGGTAALLREMGRADEALPLAERAHRMSSATMKPDDPSRMAILLGVGVVYEALERWDQTRALYDEILAIAEQTGARNNNVPITFFNRADVSRRLGDCARAIPDYQRARDLFTEYQGADSYFRIFPLRGLGQCGLQLGDLPLAITALEQAITLVSPGFAPEEVPKSKLLLGHALLRLGGDDRRGRQLIDQARSEATALGATAVTELDALTTALAPP